jgi:multicomponent Na+:H+ antiporter subunit F
MTLESPFVTTIFLLLGLALLMGFYRLMQGPSLPDRVVAVDLISSVTIGMIAVVAIATEEPVLLSVAAVVALTSFLGTIAFAYYIEQRRGR